MVDLELHWDLGVFCYHDKFSKCACNLHYNQSYTMLPTVDLKIFYDSVSVCWRKWFRKILWYWIYQRVVNEITFRKTYLLDTTNSLRNKTMMDKCICSGFSDK